MHPWVCSNPGCGESGPPTVFVGRSGGGPTNGCAEAAGIAGPKTAMPTTADSAKVRRTLLRRVKLERITPPLRRSSG
ncbi:hypothetical protein GCM10009533_22770 [Saccharopolyspora spinosporotrichia]|uniref:Uncharacterized protein n=1 Tax=Saccharopolyspora erythraea TaxID=1836 RepID=A0ABN1CPG1_SACER